jgi:hypothetical protein
VAWAVRVGGAGRATAGWVAGCGRRAAAEPHWLGEAEVARQ